MVNLCWLSNKNIRRKNYLQLELNENANYLFENLIKIGYSNITSTVFNLMTWLLVAGAEPVQQQNASYRNA